MSAIPWSQEAEQSVLGSILLDPRLIDRISEMLTPGDFYREDHQQIFAAMLSSAMTGAGIDFVAVQQDVRKSGKVDPKYLPRLVDTTPSSANVLSYAELVRDKSYLRQLYLTGIKISEVAGSFGQKAKDALTVAEAEITRIVESRRTGTGWSAPEEFVGAAMRQARSISKGETLLGRVDSGIYDLDKLTGGFYPQRFYIFAARPGMGKTALGLQMALHAANQGHGVGFFSLEMGKEDVGGRLLSIQSREPFEYVSTGETSPRRLEAHEHAAKSLARIPFHLEESGGLKIGEVRSRARTLARAGKLSILFVDYLGLIHPDARAESQNVAIGQISAGLLAIAKELKIPVVALSQLNRAVEHRADKEPTMADLRDSGNLEQDAWTITFIYREGYYKDKVLNPYPAPAKLLIKKNRSGKIGPVHVLWQPAIGCFDNTTKREF